MCVEELLMQEVIAASLLRSVEPVTPIVQADGVEGEKLWTGTVHGLRCHDCLARARQGFLMKKNTWHKPRSADLEGGMGEGSFSQHRVFLRSAFRPCSKLDLWLGLRRIAEVPAYENGDGVVPACTALDARLGWKVRPDLELSPVGRDLLDRSHPEIGGADRRREIRRSVAATVHREY